MAPEQAFGEALSPASDWYSVGVVLYEALVGRAPFVGSLTDVLQRKCVLDPPPPSSLCADVPAELDELCCALLNPDPTLRPLGPGILRRLRRPDAYQIVASVPPRGRTSPSSVARSTSRP